MDIEQEVEKELESYGIRGYEEVLSDMSDAFRSRYEEFKNCKIDDDDNVDD